ncbi:hypothetical protein NDU88_006113 [Pleurodeles waltl]|uniref:Uncharacterized protein n=1 Tax=Pleurodeles waltl TaxID=8319 RepID=A0AAV7TDC0_PLEWA|nr:hypothetical protein NDU88_006113 [Pleurodeles waltl]
MKIAQDPWCGWPDWQPDIVGGTCGWNQRTSTAGKHRGASTATPDCHNAAWSAQDASGQALSPVSEPVGTSWSAPLHDPGELRWREPWTGIGISAGVGSGRHAEDRLKATLLTTTLLKRLRR